MKTRIAMILALSLSTAAVASADVCTPSLGFGTGSATEIVLSGSNISSSAMQMGADFWGGCSSWGIPSFTVGSPRTSNPIPVQVNYIGGTPPSTVDPTWCGQVSYRVNSSNNTLIDASIDLWDFNRNGSPCDPVSTLGHELGHVLGLDNATDASCAGRIMGPGPWSPSGVTSTECNEVDKNWYYPGEDECWTCGGGGPRDDGPCGV